MNRNSILALGGTWLASVLLATAASAQDGAVEPYIVPAGISATIRSAVESASRAPEQRVRDAQRRPAEILALAGVGPADKVIEIAGFGQYYTEILAPLVGTEGSVDMYDLPYTERFGAEGARSFIARHSNTNYHLVDYNVAEFPQGVDAVFNVLYYHDLQPNGVDTAAMNSKLFAALRPGGVYLIIDHKAEAGSGWRDAGTIHRMGVETIVAEVTAAGFELALESDLLAHPEDDRSVMVFSPGTRGGTDRAVFVFRKPD
jgi:predicted methyltransferase